ncbi:MAG: hypothetical protein Q9209_000447 [Squamulea sp. 1 TL-2023]
MPKRRLPLEPQVTMGNASSQPGPPSPGPKPSARSNASRPNDTGKTTAAIPQGDHGHEGTAVPRMLPDENRHAISPFPEDDMAASVQLLAESQLSEQVVLPDAFTNPSDHINSQVRPQKNRRKGKSKRRPSILENSSDVGNMQAGRHDYSHDFLRKSAGIGEENDIVKDNLEIPPSTYSLDEIDENDEGVSPLFQEYESQVDWPAFDFDAALRDNADSLASFNELLTGATLVDQHTPSAHFKLDRSKKRKRTDTSYTDPEQFDHGAPELLNSTGQHAFELDFQAFDEMFANESAHLANPSSDESGYGIPHGNELSEDVPQAHVDDLPPVLDAEIAEVARRQSKLPRIASKSRRKKRRRTEVPNSVDSQIPMYISPYAANDEQQDSVLPGFEDNQTRSSSEIPYSQPSALSHSTTRTSPDVERKETPPPRLEKPSKPRGNKKQRGGQKGKDYRPSLQELSDKGGMFRDDEIRVLEKFRDRYCREEEIGKHRFNELIHTNVRGCLTVKRLYDAMYDELPYRTRQSVLRFCRRHFHNYATRGAWTAADDENLRDAIAKKGRSWKAVGEMLDRFPEDCRDRYRNYVINSENRVQTDTRWSQQETHSLVKAVDDCMRLLREERRQAKEDEYEGRDMPDSEPESDQEVQDLKLINWQAVSDRMGGTRSRLQCAYKFNHLKAIDKKYFMKMIRRLEAGEGSTLQADSQTPVSWRLKQSMKKLRNMRTGDKHDFLQLFANCDAVSESSILWSSLGSKEFRKRWKTMDLKAALKIFRSEVPGSERMSYQEVVNRVYTKLMAKSPGGFDDRWNSEMHGDINEIEERESWKRKGSSQATLQSQHRQVGGKQRGGRFKQRKSARFVVSEDSDDNDKVEEGQVNKENNETGTDDQDVEEDEVNKEDDEQGADYDNEGPTQDESNGESLNRQQSLEIAKSMDGDGAKQESWANSASSKGSVDNPEAVFPVAKIVEVSELNPVSEADSDSDDSLFNGDSESELVERLQSLRDA